MSTLLALSSSFVWGISDYIGGAISRETSAKAVVLWSQAVGLVVAIVGSFLLDGTPDRVSLAWGAAAGVGGAIGLVSFYRGLATGRMAVVAPVTAIVGAALPVMVGVALGERPTWATISGMALALSAIWLVSGGGGIGGRHGLALAAAAGTGFGLFFVFLDRTDAMAGLWPLVPARVASVTTMAALILVTRSSARIERPIYSGILAAGAGDMLANMLFLGAVRTGLLSVVAVLASLYPAVTVVLARVFGEEVSKTQWLGVAVALGAVALIAA